MSWCLASSTAGFRSQWVLQIRPAPASIPFATRNSCLSISVHVTGRHEGRRPSLWACTWKGASRHPSSPPAMSENRWPHTASPKARRRVLAAGHNCRWTGRAGRLWPSAAPLSPPLQGVPRLAPRWPAASSVRVIQRSNSPIQVCRKAQHPASDNLHSSHVRNDSRCGPSSRLGS